MASIKSCSTNTRGNKFTVTKGIDEDIVTKEFTDQISEIYKNISGDSSYSFPAVVSPPFVDAAGPAINISVSYNPGTSMDNPNEPVDGVPFLGNTYETDITFDLFTGNLYVSFGVSSLVSLTGHVVIPWSSFAGTTFIQVNEDPANPGNQFAGMGSAALTDTLFTVSENTGTITITFFNNLNDPPVSQTGRFSFNVDNVINNSPTDFNDLITNFFPTADFFYPSSTLSGQGLDTTKVNTSLTNPGLSTYSTFLHGLVVPALPTNVTTLPLPSYQGSFENLFLAGIQPMGGTQSQDAAINVLYYVSTGTLNTIVSGLYFSNTANVEYLVSDMLNSTNTSPVVLEEIIRKVYLTLKAAYQGIIDQKTFQRCITECKYVLSVTNKPETDDCQ